MNVVEKKRFVVSKGMIGKELVIQFTNKKVMSSSMTTTVFTL